jgi:hypothetical protein
MTEREPIEITNLDIYGSAPLPWSRPRDLLEASATSNTTFFLGTVRPDGRPHAAGIGALWLDGDLYFPSGPQLRKARNLAANPACTISVKLEGIDLILEGDATRVTDQPTLETVARLYRRRWVACAGGGRCLHGAVQSPERPAAPLATLPLNVPHCLRGRHRRAVRCDALAIQPLIGGLPGCCRYWNRRAPRWCSLARGLLQ